MATDQQIEIIVLPALFRVVSMNMHGAIWLKQSEKSFPEENWDDFVIVILGWWIEATLSVFDGLSNETILYFMDGSFHIRLSTTESIWKLDCVSRFISREEIEYSFQSKPIEFLNTLIIAASQSIQRCEEMAWISPDLTKLISLYEETKRRLQF